MPSSVRAVRRPARGLPSGPPPFAARAPSGCRHLLQLPVVSAPARQYLIRTYGCQMNEHDSRRLAGILEADGMVPTEDPAAADVVVLNTC